MLHQELVLVFHIFCVCFLFILVFGSENYCSFSCAPFLVEVPLAFCWQLSGRPRELLVTLASLHCKNRTGIFSPHPLLLPLFFLVPLLFSSCLLLTYPLWVMQWSLSVCPVTWSRKRCGRSWQPGVDAVIILDELVVTFAPVQFVSF